MEKQRYMTPRYITKEEKIGNNTVRLHDLERTEEEAIRYRANLEKELQRFGAAMGKAGLL